MKRKILAVTVAIACFATALVYAEETDSVKTEIEQKQALQEEARIGQGQAKEETNENQENQSESEQKKEQQLQEEQEMDQTKIEKKQSEEGNYRLEAENSVTRPDYNIYAHPGNVAAILGVGENNKITIRYGGNQVIEIPVSSPLYRISSVYQDSIKRKDGIWGIERMVGKQVFDGSENWVLEDNYKNYNTYSTLFSYEPEVNIKIKSGMSTHFQVTGGLEKSEMTAEGISMTPSKWYFRVSNVRNIKSLDVWTQYLLAQYQNNTPVTVYYILPETEFEPLGDELQNILENLDIKEIRYTEGVQPKIVSLPQTSDSIYPFLTTDTWQEKEDLKKLISAITDIKIFNADPEDKFFLSSVEVTENGECILKISKQNLEGAEAVSSVVCSGRFSFLDMDFITDKATEIAFIPEESSIISASAKINFSEFQIPEKSFFDLTYEEAGLHPNCIMEKELVLPEVIPVVEGKDFRIYYENTVLNGDFGKTDMVTVAEGKTEVTGEERYLSCIPQKDSGKWKQKLTLIAGNDSDAKVQTYDTNFITVPKETGKGITKSVLFLGDSLLAQDYYTQAVADLFEEDEMEIKFVGTKGLETSRHEGRGGWSAYDYCRAEVRYGETNPFLENGKFNFTSYMEKNQFPTVDIVFVNLGINDLNQAGHNSHEEIIANYKEIIESIQKFNPEVQIVLGMPTLPFAKDSTVTAKNTRLNFVKTLKKEFGGKEEEGLFLLPLYVNIDPFTDYKFEQPLPNGALDVTDTSHPAVSGYQRLGETSYHMIKYIQYLEEIQR